MWAESPVPTVDIPAAPYPDRTAYQPTTAIKATNITVLTIGYAAGYYLNATLASSLTASIDLQLPATGPARATDFAALKQLAGSLPTTNSLSTGMPAHDRDTWLIVRHRTTAWCM